MYPMDLEEVLWAKGKQILSDTIREHYNSNVPLEDALHEEAMQEFYHYCIVGGMPAGGESRPCKRQSYRADGNQTDVIKLLYCGYDKICE